MCAPFCCAAGLNWLDTCGGGMPAAEETGDFIAPEVMNRHLMNIIHALRICTAQHLKCWQWIYRNFGCRLEKSFTRWWRRSSVMPIEWLCGTRAEPTLEAPHPWLGLGVGGCSNITLLAHVERSVMPGRLLTTCFMSRRHTVCRQQFVGKCCVHVY